MELNCRKLQILMMRIIFNVISTDLRDSIILTNWWWRDRPIMMMIIIIIDRIELKIQTREKNESNTDNLREGVEIAKIASNSICIIGYYVLNWKWNENSLLKQDENERVVVIFLCVCLFVFEDDFIQFNSHYTFFFVTMINNMC